MTFFALKHRASGQFMPASCGSSGRGYTHWDPAVLGAGIDNCGTPRLFKTRRAAQTARTYWARGALALRDDFEEYAEPATVPPPAYADQFDALVREQIAAPNYARLGRTVRHTIDPQGNVHTDAFEIVVSDTAPAEAEPPPEPPYVEFGTAIADAGAAIAAGFIVGGGLVGQGAVIGGPIMNQRIRRRRGLSPVRTHTRTPEDLDIIEVEVLELTRDLLA